MIDQTAVDLEFGNRKYNRRCRSRCASITSDLNHSNDPAPDILEPVANILGTVVDAVNGKGFAMNIKRDVLYETDHYFDRQREYSSRR